MFYVFFRFRLRIDGPYPLSELALIDSSVGLLRDVLTKKLQTAYSMSETPVFLGEPILLDGSVTMAAHNKILLFVSSINPAPAASSPSDTIAGSGQLRGQLEMAWNDSRPTGGTVAEASKSAFFKRLSAKLVALSGESL